MGVSSEPLELELFIRRPPESVRAWWTDLPDDYQAKDPREEPYRIVTLRKFPNGRLLLTYWHDDEDGSTYERHEVLLTLPDGGWTVEMTDSPYFHIRDEFQVRPGEGGSYVHLRQMRIPKDPSYASMIPEIKKEMIGFFKTMGEICERDAP